MALTVATVGLGRRGRAHLDSWRGLPDLRIVGAADHAERQDPHGLPVWRDHHALLAACGPPDVVSVAVDAEHHVPVTEDLLDAGVGIVVVEKPVATTLADVERLAARPDAHRVAVGFHESFHPRLSSIAGEGWRFVSMVRRGPRPARRHPGLLLELVIHDVHLAQRAAGRALSVLSARGDGDAVHVTLTDGAGFEATIDTGWAAHRRRQVRCVRPGHAEQVDLLVGAQHGPDAPLARLLADATAAHREQRAPSIGLDLGLAAHRLLDDIAAVLPAGPTS